MLLLEINNGYCSDHVFLILQVKVYHFDPHLPMVDQAVLMKAHHFIGNCVSSFTAFVKRARDVNQMETSFWGL